MQPSHDTLAVTGQRRTRLAMLLVSLLVSTSACIAVPLAPELRTIGTPASQRFESPSIRVLCWNIYKSNREGWREDFVRLAASHDLLLLQEGYWDDETEPVFAGVAGMGWWLGVAFEYTYESPRPVSGTFIGSRSRPIRPVVFFHSPYREALIGTPKSHIAGTFSMAGTDERLLAVSVHATNLHIDQDAFDAHVDQILGRVALHRGPVVLAGDFNTWSESRTAYLFARVTSLGLTSVFDRGPASEERDDGRMSFSDNYLDHAFVRGLVAKPGARVLRELNSSDHKALSFTVSLPESTGEKGGGTAL